MTEAEHAAAPRERKPKADPAPVLYETPAAVAPSGPVSVTTRGSALLGPRDAARRALVQDDVPARLLAKDATLWGPAAEEEAAKRLGWLDLPRTSLELLPALKSLRTQLSGEGIDRVVLCGMGGSSLAPEVICATYGVPLTVLDTTDPGQVRAVLADVGNAVFVVSSKSGSTIETDSHLRLAVAAAAALPGGGAAGTAGWERIVVVTDPGSPLAETATANGARAVFLADPDVGGRYSALSAFGLVPSALAGADVDQVVADATTVLADLGGAEGNPGLDLGAALGGCGAAGRDKVVLIGAAAGFADWVEQLLAESTGKDGRGLLPVVVEGPEAPGTAFTAVGDVHPVRFDGSAPSSTIVSGPLGAAFLVWEYATAIAGRVLRVNPFDQPDVEAAKASARTFLDSPSTDAGDAIEVPGGADLTAVLRDLLDAIPPTGYLAIQAYLDGNADAAAATLRGRLAALTKRPVTFGWGPRFLHSTGQYHKGGPANGVFLQITGAVTEDVEVPGRPFTLGQLQRAQALGDARVLAERGQRVVRLHLTDRAAGLAALLAAVPAPPE